MNGGINQEKSLIRQRLACAEKVAEPPHFYAYTVAEPPHFYAYTVASLRIYGSRTTPQSEAVPYVAACPLYTLYT